MKLFVAYPCYEGEAFLTDKAKAYLSERFEVSYWEGDQNPTPSEIGEYARDCDAIITGWGQTAISYEDIKHTNIKYIAHLGGTVGTLVGEGLYENNIRILSGNEIYAESVAEGTIAYMLSGLRRIPTYVDNVRNGGWRGDGFFSQGLLDQTVGIISLGAISRYLISMLHTFRAKVKIYSGHQIDEAYLKEHQAEQVSLEEIFSTCNIVSLHSASTEKTRGMIGKEHFDLLQDGALFINTARGPIIREEEMVEALKQKRFSAVLDVFCQEPLEEDSLLRTLPNVYCMPHMGGPTLDRREIVTMRLADNILKLENREEAELLVNEGTAKRMTSQP